MSSCSPLEDPSRLHRVPRPPSQLDPPPRLPVSPSISRPVSTMSLTSALQPLEVPTDHLTPVEPSRRPSSSERTREDSPTTPRTGPTISLRPPTAVHLPTSSLAVDERSPAVHPRRTLRSTLPTQGADARRRRARARREEMTRPPQRAVPRLPSPTDHQNRFRRPPSPPLLSSLRPRCHWTTRSDVRSSRS